MPSSNTLDLARQGDPEALATILTYHLTQRYNMTASAIRLGNYLSVLVEARFAPDRHTLVGLVQEIVQSLAIAAITIIEISARQIDGRQVLWSQTIELPSEHHLTTMNDETSMANPASADLPALETAPAEILIANFTPSDIVPSPTHSEAVVPPSVTTPQTTPTTALVPADQTSLVAITSTPPEAQKDEWNQILNKLMERPEMLAIVAFALVVVCWNAYIEWMTEVDSAQSLSGIKLAHRLGVNYNTLDRYKSRPNFSTWSQDLDPDGIAWSYENNQFIPKVGANGRSLLQR